MKRLCADDSAATSVKVGYRQASYKAEPAQLILSGLFAFYNRNSDVCHRGRSRGVRVPDPVQLECTFRHARQTGTAGR